MQNEHAVMGETSATDAAYRRGYKAGHAKRQREDGNTGEVSTLSMDTINLKDITELGVQLKRIADVLEAYARYHHL